MRKLICMTGSAADRAVTELIEQQPLLAERFPARFLAHAKSPEPAAPPKFAEMPVSIGEGGLWAALWKLGEAAQTGLAVDAAAVFIRQESVEICEFLGLDPYALPSCGTVFLCDPQDVLEASEERINRLISSQEMQEEGAQAPDPAFFVIGHTTAAQARTVRIGDRIRYLNRSAE